MTEKLCAICGRRIPGKTREELIDEGYNFLSLGNKYYRFCPKHNAKEISDFILELVRK